MKLFNCTIFSVPTLHRVLNLALLDIKYVYLVYSDISEKLTYFAIDKTKPGIPWSGLIHWEIKALKYYSFEIVLK